MKHKRLILSAILILGLASTSNAAIRAFVSGTGIDTGTCPVTAPCRSFAYALTQIVSGGEIIAVDTAGYGAAAINFSVAIIAAPGVTAFATAGSGNVFSVVAGASDVVTLRGLTITAGGATNGVVFTTGQSLNLENCIINGHVEGVFSSRPGDTTKPRIAIDHCAIRNNTIGVDVSDIGPGTPAGGPPANLTYVTITNSLIETNTNFGVFAEDNSRFVITDTTFTGNSSGGLIAQAGADYSFSSVTLDRCTFSRNGYGVIAGDGTATQLPHGVVRLANCTISANDVGIATNQDGSILSRLSNSSLTNTIEGNTADGTPTGTYSAK